jgi:hypothetical protein
MRLPGDLGDCYFEIHLNASLDGLDTQVEQRHTSSLLDANARTRPQTVHSAEEKKTDPNTALR